MTAVAPPAPMPADATFTPDLLRGRLTETAFECQRTLAANPHDVKALLGMSLIALVSGQHVAAVQMAQAAVAEAPALGSAWIALGQSLKAAGRLVDAEHAYESAIRLDGTDPLARLGLAELNLTAGCPEQAARECEAALRRAPGLAAAHMDLGHAMACMEAAVAYAKERCQFGRPIAGFQLVQAKLATMQAATTAMQLMCFRLAQLQESGTMTGAMASLAKLHNVRNAKLVCSEARDILGGTAMRVFGLG